MPKNAVMNWVQQLDRLLRGDATRLSSLRRGTIELPENGLTMVIFALGLLYGGCMGCFALLNRPPSHAVLQLVSSMAKVPILFFLTLVVTFPSLYVFNALVGSRLSMSSMWRLMIAMLAVMMAILASLGPIVAFFSLSTNNYGFMLILNVAVFALAGFLGLKFLLHTLHRLSTVLSESEAPSEATPTDANSDATLVVAKQGALDRLEDRMLGSDVKTVFNLWILVFGLVGAQMSWVLRPFIGNPGARHFVLFSPRESNFYTALWDTFVRILGG